MNDIDFLRRNGEWSERRVVGDIEATIDLGGERLFAGTGGQQLLILRFGVLRRDQELSGCDLVAACLQPR